MMSVGVADMTSLSQLLSDIEPVPFDPEDKVLPQIEEMTFNTATSESALVKVENCWYF